jgi:hypothetical protein
VKRPDKVKVPLEANKRVILFYGVSLPPSSGMCCLSGGHMYKADVTHVPIV